jgi:2-polyprenyl-3-methyl-5-hydroxy-6-metoxy-1,4-benzoquinol methylase
MRATLDRRKRPWQEQWSASEVTLESRNRTKVPKMRCWICGSTDTAAWKPRSLGRPLTAEDLQITDDHYGTTLALWRCRGCQFIFADGDDLLRLTALYEHLSDPEYVESQHSRAPQMRWLIHQVMRAHPNARSLLDVGAGAGLLVAEALRRGLAAVGVEPSRSLVESAREVNGVELIRGLFPQAQLAGRRFDVICLVDVIEHVTDPVQMLRDCAAALGPDGLLMVVTPDVGSLAAGLLGTRWWHLRAAHVGYFNATSIRRASAEAGLDAIRVFRAKWFFQVGYVAERLERYLPIAWLNRLAQRRRMMRRFFAHVVSLNPHDSLGLLLHQRKNTP